MFSNKRRNTRGKSTFPATNVEKHKENKHVVQKHVDTTAPNGKAEKYFLEPNGRHRPKIIVLTK